MNKCENDYKKIFKKIRVRFIPMVIIILILIFASQATLQYHISQDKYFSRGINVAARQILYSQMIKEDILRLSQYIDQDERIFYLDQLKSAVSTWEKANIDMHKSNQDGLLENSSDEINTLYLSVEESHQTMLQTTYGFIEIMETENYSKDVLLEKVKAIQSNANMYIKGLNQIIDQYNKEYNVKVERIDNITTILFLIVLLSILFQIIYIYRISNKLFLKACNEKREENENIIKLFRNLNGGLFIVEEKSLHIILMNEDAEAIVKNNTDNCKGQNIAEVIQWESLEGIHISKKIKAENKVCNLEIKIRENDEKTSTYYLSTAKGNFRGNAVILISLFDITLQKQAEETLRKLVIKDELTGLYNRYFMYTIIEEEMERSVRYNYPVSIAILDLDYFKRINDNWGHPVGDLVLQQTAEMASNSIRKSDFLIRLGGEEFLIIMPHTNINDAVIVAEKIRMEIEDYTHPMAGKFTASLGVTQRIKDESFQTIYERADAALYRAKNEGRNRVVSFENQADMPIASVYLEWKMEWNSGNKEIDEQHKELLEIANSIMYASLSNKDKEKAKLQIDLLIQRINYHFEYEDEILKKIKYPDSQNHFKTHQNLLKEVEELQNSYQKGEVKPPVFFMFMVDEVIVGHLLERDTKFFSYLQENII